MSNSRFVENVDSKQLFLLVLKACEFRKNLRERAVYDVNFKAYMRAVGLRFRQASESPAGLVKTHCGSAPRDFRFRCPLGGGGVCAALQFPAGTAAAGPGAPPGGPLERRKQIVVRSSHVLMRSRPKAGFFDFCNIKKFLLTHVFLLY